MIKTYHLQVIPLPNGGTTARCKLCEEDFGTDIKAAARHKCAALGKAIEVLTS